MFHVKLVNMPFGAIHLPSIALTQLKAVLDDQLGSSCSTEICYLNHHVAHSLGVDLYRFISDSSDSNNVGLGDWFFRQSAFPQLPDNSEQYFQRYFPRHDPHTNQLKQIILQKRHLVTPLLDDLINEFQLDQADLIGLTSMFAQNVACFALARMLKERRPEILVVMGGANCEAPMGNQIVRNVSTIDFVFSGPSLKSFPDLIRRQMHGEHDASHRIAGVLSRGNCSLQQHDMPATYGEELNINYPINLQYDDFLNSIDELFPEGYLGTQPTLLFETSRGCWWGQRAHCTFCGLNGTTMTYREMPPNQALRQFQSLFRYVPRVKHFQCVDNIMPRKYPREVFAQLDVPNEVSIFYETKADLTTEEIAILSKSGVDRIQPGIESLATSTLKLMRKGSTSFQNIRLLMNCMANKVKPFWNLLVGFPRETEDVYCKYLSDLPLFAHLPPPIGVFPVRFDRFSPYFTQADRYGLNLQPLDYYSLTYPFAQDAICGLAYYFADRNLSADYIISMLNWIIPLRNAVNSWKDRWSDSSQNDIPQLVMFTSSGAATLYDSRFSDAEVYTISEPCRQALLFLEKPNRLSALHAYMADAFPNVDFEETLSVLQERKLLFRDEEQYMSLVLCTSASRDSVSCDADKGSSLSTQT